MINSNNTITSALADKLNRGRSLRQAKHELRISDAQVGLHFDNALKNGCLTADAIRSATTTERIPFPDDLERRVSATISSLDGVLKIAALLSLTNQPQSISSIKGFIESMFKVRLTNSVSLDSYCRDSFVPRGISNTHIIALDSRAHTYFAASPEGAQFVQPIAAYTMHFLSNIGLMPRELFGRGHSPNQNSRGPYNVFMILEELHEPNGRGHSSHTNGGSTCAMIGREIGLEHGNVMRHLKRLEHAGICYRLDTSSRKEHRFALTQRGESVLDYMQNVAGCFTNRQTRVWLESFYSTLLTGTGNSHASKSARSSFIRMLVREEGERRAGHQGTRRGVYDREKILSYVADFEGDTLGPCVAEVARHVGTNDQIARRLLGELESEGSLYLERAGKKTISLLTP